MTRLGIYLVLAVLASSAVRTEADDPAVEVRIGSKKFTESVIIGEMLSHLVGEAGAQPIHRRELGGTRVLFNALQAGDLDVYPEYTGTITQEILADRDFQAESAIRSALAEMGIVMGKPLGFNNTYALGMRKPDAARFGIKTISDLRNQPQLRFGFTNEFMDRGDGWPSLLRRYGLPQENVRGLDHDLAYRGLQAGDIDLIDLYSTDAEIQYYDLFVLVDDLQHFPRYEAVLLFRADLANRVPGVVTEWNKLEGEISTKQMMAMNAQAKLERVHESAVAADFLNRRWSLNLKSDQQTRLAMFWQTTWEHLCMVGISMLAAVLVAVPLGVWAAKQARIAQIVLGGVGIIQTIPALALLVLLIKPLKIIGLPGLGAPPAIVALFLYSLLPIVRNTYTGLVDIPAHIRESALALGLPGWARLRLVELPLASRMILAGIKTAAVINIGFATLGALIGAGGYGQPILTGIRLDDYGLIMMGAVPAAGLALVAQGLFECAERLLVPKGLRINT